MASAPREETLDPADWDAYARSAHALLDELIALQRNVRDMPVWRPVSEDAARQLDVPLPREGQALDEVLADVMQHVAAYPLGNPHPRFWGWVMGNGTPDAVLAEAIVAATNPNMGGGDHMANRVEPIVLRWLAEMLGWPPSASGLFVSGGSLANLTALAVARHAKADFDVRSDGLRAGPQLVAYGSAEMHSSNARAFEVLGVGARHVRSVPVLPDGSMDAARLGEAIRADRAAGLRPFAVVGTAGTTNTGAIDPLDEIADVARDEDLWFHVDGAFGALAWLAPAERARLRGMERADSLAFDLHKWGWLPFDCGVVLVKDAAAHLEAFTVHPPYLAHHARGIGGQHEGLPWTGDMGIELSRTFRGLKAYVALRTHGAEKWGRIVQQNIDLARHLADRVGAHPHLELLAPVTLNIACFRYIKAGRDDAALDAANEEILLRIQESGFAAPSGTKLSGRFAIRCSITNHRTTRADIDAFVERVVETGDEILR